MFLLDAEDELWDDAKGKGQGTPTEGGTEGAGCAMPAEEGTEGAGCAMPAEGSTEDAERNGVIGGNASTQERNTHTPAAAAPSTAGACPEPAKDVPPTAAARATPAPTMEDFSAWPTPFPSCLRRARLVALCFRRTANANAVAPLPRSVSVLCGWNGRALAGAVARGQPEARAGEDHGGNVAARRQKHIRGTTVVAKRRRAPND